MLFKGDRIVLPEPLQQISISLAHRGAHSGQCGIGRRLGYHFFYHGMFKKVKNFDATANVLAYAYFQAFKFPDSMNVHFQCVVQVCRGACPEPQCGGGGGGGVLPPSRPNQDSYGAPAAQVDRYVLVCSNGIFHSWG